MFSRHWWALRQRHLGRDWFTSSVAGKDVPTLTGSMARTFQRRGVGRDRD